MGNNQTGLASQVEVRPAYVEDWLDTLPYADFNKTAYMLQGALSGTNAQRIKPAQRFGLIEIYLRPYRYLLNHYVKAEVLPSVHALEAKQQQIEALRQIALEMGFACRQAIEETLNRKTLWLHNKPSPRQLLLAVKLLSHTLILSYQAYSPVPKNTWRELNEAFLMAEQLGLLSALTEDPMQETRTRTSVLMAYLQIAATSLVDPHHLPQGSVWQIYDQLHDWSKEIQVQPFQRRADTLGYSVIDLKGSAGPVSLARFEAAGITPYHRMLNCSALYRVVQLHIERLNKGHGGDANLVLAAPSAQMLLRQLLSAWGQPPLRHAERRPRSGTLSLAAGINAAYFHVNGRREFCRGCDEEEEAGYVAVEAGAAAPAPADTAATYVLETWSFVNEGPGGFAVYRSTRPETLIRVGELVGMMPKDTQAEGWVVGVVRWLMIHKRHEHRIGLQIIGERVRPVALRAITGSRTDREFRRALLVRCPQGESGPSLITSRGLFASGRTLEVDIDGNAKPVQSADLVESTIAFEQFRFARRS